MSDSNLRWIIRDEKGQIRGPYLMAQILKYINEGHLTGEELIARYPDGEWSMISRDPEFYDKILESIENQITPKPPQPESEETVFIRPPEYKSKRKIEQTEPLIVETAKLEPQKSLTVVPDEKRVSETQSGVTFLSQKKTATSNITVNDTKPAEENPNKDKGSVIDLMNISDLKKIAIKQKTKPLFLTLLGVISLFIYIIFSASDKYSDKISLIMPQKNGTPLSEKQVQERLGIAIKAIEGDTFENYLEAQNKLVSVVEGAPTNLDARGLLCYVYKELWPFAKQDIEDQKVLNLISQTTRVLNVAHSSGNYCEAVKLYSIGRFKEARGTIEGILDTGENFSLLPIVYQFKAETLEVDKDVVNAIPYYEKAAQYWDTWLKPKASLGLALAKNNNGPKAAEFLRQVITKNPKHKVARIGLGLVEFRLFKQLDMALTTLSAAVDVKSRVPKVIESEAYLVLADILFQNGSRSKAIANAEIAFALNPSSEEIKKLCERVGCSQKLKPAVATKEIEILCDQFARSGDYLAAQAECKAAFELDPKSGSAAMKAGKYLWMLNQSFEATEWLKKAIKAEPKMISAYVLLADYLSQRYDFLGATQILIEATRIAPNNYEILRGMALLEFRKNNLPGALNYGTRSLKIFDADIETYIILARASRLLVLNLNGPKDGEKRESAARDAIRYSTKAVELDGTNSDAQIAYAEMLSSTSGVDTGITYLKELIKKYSHSYEYRVALADLMRSEERFSQAKEIYELVTLQEPKNKRALIGLGLCYKALTLNDKALRAFLGAAIVDPTDAEPLFLSGKIYQENNKYEEAINQFKRALKVNPFLPRIHYNLGRTALLVGDLDTALNEAKEEKNINPNVADSYVLSGEVLSAKKQYSECAAEYSVAMKLRPQGADIYVKAAQCYRQSGSIDIAQDMLDLAKIQESGYPDMYKEQGVISQLKRDNQAALFAYCTYIKLSPNALDRHEISSLIVKLGGNPLCE